MEEPFFVPDNEAIIKCKEEFSMELTVSTGQRKLKLANFNGSPSSSECFIGSINRSVLEPGIMELLKSVDAQVHDIRLMMGKLF